LKREIYQIETQKSKRKRQARDRRKRLRIRGRLQEEIRKSEREGKIGSVVWEENTAKTQCRKFETNIPRKGIARSVPISTFMCL
jgi:hypothetical protein